MVNIIIPLYNGKDTLPLALNSLLTQTKKFFQVSIYQDGDSEDYSEIINKYRYMGLFINFYKNEKNVGAGLARQFWLNKSKRFEYVMFLDCDDVLMPNAVESLSRAAAVSNSDIVVGNILQEEIGNNKILRKDSNSTWLHGKLYRTSFLLENNITFHPLIKVNEDSYFNFVALNSTNNKHYIDETVYMWRWNRNSITRRSSKKDFLEENDKYYFIGQIYGLEKLKELNKLDDELVCSVLVNLYRQSQLEIFYGLEPTTIDHLLSLKCIINTQEKIFNGELNEVLLPLLGAGGIENGKAFLFTETFFDWLRSNK